MEEYFYDDKGRLKKETVELSSGVSGSATYAYDDEKLECVMTCDKHKGWFDGVLVFKADKDWNNQSGKIFKADEEIGTVSFDYDAHGNLLRERWDFNGKWSQTFSYDYEPIPVIRYTSANAFMYFNNPQYRIKQEHYDYSGKNGGPSYFTYDRAGRLVEKKFVRQDGLTTITTFAYDDKTGHLTRSHRRYNDGQTAEFTYKYTDDERLAERIYKHADGTTGIEQFDYDQIGRLVSGTYENMDTWLTGKLSFTHDENDKLASGIFTGEKFNADITFTYSEEGNLEKIHWDFSYGGTQTYTFEYEQIPPPGRNFK